MESIPETSAFAPEARAAARVGKVADAAGLVALEVREALREAAAYLAAGAVTATQEVAEGSGVAWRARDKPPARTRCGCT